MITDKQAIFAKGKDAAWFSLCGMDNVVKELIRFKNLMDKIGKTFFLAGGTGLGIVRNGALLNHDKDIDVAVLGEENLYEIKEELSDYYDQAHIVEAAPVNGKILWLKQVINEGILPIEVAAHYIKDDYVYYNRDMGESWKWREGKIVFKKKLFDRFEQVSFGGTSFNIPSPVDEYLTAFYGADWRIPKRWKDWRYNCYNLYKGYWK